MPKQAKNLPVRGNLALHLIFDLRAHERKLLRHLMRVEIASDLDELGTRLLDLPPPDELSRRVRHEGRQPREHDHPPGDLDAQGEAPLRRSVRCVAARVPDPVGHHRAEGDAAAGDAADEAAVVGGGDLAAKLVRLDFCGVV